MSTNGTVGIGGYSCPTCGAWVVSGTTHTCFGRLTQPQQPITYTYYYPNRDAEILSEIQKIRELLTEILREPVAKKKPPMPKPKKKGC